MPPVPRQIAAHFPTHRQPENNHCLQCFDIFHLLDKKQICNLKMIMAYYNAIKFSSSGSNERYCNDSIEKWQQDVELFPLMFLIKASDLSQFWTLWYLMILWDHQIFWKPEKELWFVIFKNMPPRLPLLWNWTGLNSKVGAAIHFTFTSVKLLYILHFSNLSARLLLCHKNYASLCNWATARSECNTVQCNKVQYKDGVQ